MTLQEKHQKATQIIAEFKAMRTLQKKYFATRDYEILRQSKAQESKVDKILREYDEDQSQGKLF